MGRRRKGREKGSSVLYVCEGKRRHSVRLEAIRAAAALEQGAAQRGNSTRELVDQDPVVAASGCRCTSNRYEAKMSYETAIHDDPGTASSTEIPREIAAGNVSRICTHSTWLPTRPQTSFHETPHTCHPTLSGPTKTLPPLPAHESSPSSLYG